MPSPRSQSDPRVVFEYANVSEWEPTGWESGMHWIQVCIIGVSLFFFVLGCEGKISKESRA